MIGLTLIVAAALAAHAPEPILGEFTLDVVELHAGRETPGLETIALEHANFRYRFATPESRDAFTADPDRYAVALGGACGRMGALSGTGDPARYALHDDRLYIFASDGCKATFLKDPDAVLETDDPPLSPTRTQAALARDLLDAAATWLGADNLPPDTVLRIGRESQREWQGQMRRSADFSFLGPPGHLRIEQIWGADVSATVLTPDDAFLLRPDGSVRTMHPDQRRAAERILARNLLSILRARNDPGFVASADLADGPIVVETHHAGVRNTLTIDGATGAVLRHATLRRAPTLALGVQERAYTNWQTVSGVKVPTAWTTTFDGQPIDAPDAPPLDARLLPLGPGLFARP